MTPTGGGDIREGLARHAETLREHERRIARIEPGFEQIAVQVAKMAAVQESQGREIAEIKSGVGDIQTRISGIQEMIHNDRMDAAERRSRLLQRLAALGASMTTAGTLITIWLKYMQ